MNKGIPKALRPGVPGDGWVLDGHLLITTQPVGSGRGFLIPGAGAVCDGRGGQALRFLRRVGVLAATPAERTTLTNPSRQPGRQAAAGVLESFRSVGQHEVARLP